MTVSQPEKDVNSLGSYYTQKLVFYKDKKPKWKDTVDHRATVRTSYAWHYLLFACWQMHNDTSSHYQIYSNYILTVFSSAQL